MPLNKLNPIKIQKIKKAGLYSDGGGLYVQARKSTSNDASKNKTAFAKSYIFRYSIDGRERWMGLGSVNDVPLDQAREDAAKYRGLKKRSIDPLQHNQRLASQDAANADEDKTFKDCAISYIEAHKAGWKSRKHESQWRNTLKTYAYPVIGNRSIQTIDVALVLKILEPIWYEKTETASRVRQRIENILDWATARKYRTGENPARWRGHLDKLLPRRSKVQKVKHFNAMPYADLPKYYEKLKTQETMPALALAFTILTATRVSESRNAAWKEINLKTKEWNIPDIRMKADRPHRVPLSKEAVSVLKRAKKLSSDSLVFEGNVLNKPISDSSIRQLLQDDYPELTVHGFRSTFRDWCAEITSYPREVAEAALAHTIKDATERAYQRGDIFKKRLRLMDAWASYVACQLKHC